MTYDEFEIVYVIRDEHNRMKIGKSTFTKNQFVGRLSTMQTGNADNLTVEVVFQSDELSIIALEHELHNSLLSKYIRGEWYNCNLWDIFDAIANISMELSIEIDCYKQGCKHYFKSECGNDFDNYGLYLCAKCGELRWIK